MLGKDLKNAIIHEVELDEVRPVTFDFNTLVELQSLGYENPYLAIQLFSKMNLRAVRSMVYACLCSGHEAKYDTPFPYKVGEIGTIIGQLMMSEKDKLANIIGEINQAISDFFPKSEETDEEEQDPKN